jgi:hypothetical protein
LLDSIEVALAYVAGIKNLHKKELLLGKKRSRKTYKSKGLYSNVANKHKFDIWSSLDRALFKAEALAAGKKVCYTIPNPDKENTKARFIKVCVNGK